VLNWTKLTLILENLIGLLRLQFTPTYFSRIVWCSMMSLLSCRMGMGGIWELLDGKIWEWDLSFRWEWDGNEVTEMGGNWYEKSIPAHLYCIYCDSDTTVTEPVVFILLKCADFKFKFHKYFGVVPMERLRYPSRSGSNPSNVSSTQKLGDFGVNDNRRGKEKSNCDKNALLPIEWTS